MVLRKLFVLNLFRPHFKNIFHSNSHFNITLFLNCEDQCCRKKKSDIITRKQEKQNNKEKTYSCDICERSCESNSKFIIHKRVQSEVKP